MIILGSRVNSTSPKSQVWLKIGESQKQKNVNASLPKFIFLLNVKTVTGKSLFNSILFTNYSLLQIIHYWHILCIYSELGINYRSSPSKVFWIPTKIQKWMLLLNRTFREYKELCNLIRTKNQTSNTFYEMILLGFYITKKQRLYGSFNRAASFAEHFHLHGNL